MPIKTLDVYLNQTLTGQLSIDSYGDMLFDYDENYLSAAGSLPLSHSLPLQKKTYAERECRPFFNGILPESHLRASIARQLGISEKMISLYWLPLVANVPALLVCCLLHCILLI